MNKIMLETERKVQRLASNLYQITIPKEYSAIIRDAQIIRIIPRQKRTVTLRGLMQ